MVRPHQLYDMAFEKRSIICLLVKANHDRDNSELVAKFHA